MIVALPGFFSYLLCPVCYLVGPVWHCNHLIGVEGAGCFAFLCVHYENKPIQIY